MNHRKKTSVLWICYMVLMLILLFGRSGRIAGVPYWEQVQMGLNLKPFHTIRMYLQLLVRDPESYLFRHALVNLLGNVVMFVPLGYFLPALFQKTPACWKTILTGGGIIVLVELLQLVSLLGSCDVDDLILNLLGIWLGYGLQWWHLRLRK